MKRMNVVLCVLLLLCVLLPIAAQGTKVSVGEVTLTMGSWRTDDVVQMNRLLAEYKKVAPNVTIKFQPTNPPDYNATLRLQLDSNTGPDLMYARSYAAGEELFKAGYFADCTDIPGLMQNFTASNLAPWQMDDGKMFAVPFAAVSHAVYYNKDIFRKEGLAIPQSWEDFLAVLRTLKSRGYTPLANGLADEWDILETFFLGMLPNFIGGADQRVRYESGELKLNDASFVAAYQAMADAAPYCPVGFESVTYNDSQVLFASQKAVMFVDGSWTAEVYKDAAFDWGLFAIPAPRGKKTAICFHPDMAITMNRATTHPDEARAFLAWLCTREGATMASENLPVGYFPMINFPITLTDVHANEFLALNSGKETDARFVWPALMDLYAPMNQAVIRVMKGQVTAKQAADSVAALF
ncbi:MAG: extracellular solute-binding protein [Sphaerochaeta sp.]|nr:extracellular solute-binding protein [Sphaerochaeta sp.]MDX9914352.1 extracellular solute-binding protein [Sphaerochaeta sp.]